MNDGTYSAAYTYVANSPLVSTITFKDGTTTRMTTTKQYDLMNRLISISSQPSASGERPIAFTYAYNNANQRRQRNDSDGTFWNYGYDYLGQVTSGKRYWTPIAGQQFEYAYDDIGNRTSTKAGGDSNGANLRSASYAVNSLNQYTSRDVPGAVDIIGISHAQSTTTVNEQSPYRRGEYFHKEVSINNSSAAQYASITNLAWLSGVTNTNTGSIFLPKAAETFGYDADGNLTNDGRWVLSWDGENRLIGVESHTSAPTLSKRRVDYAYDHAGRLIRRVAYDGSSGSYALTEALQFTHEGSRILAELASNTLLRSYLWGLDLSVSGRAAGNVGGLISILSLTNGPHFYAYDGNGNVVALITATNGNVTAAYEFDPFGSLSRSTGIMAAENVWRFSTKRGDLSSEFVHYEARCYSPSIGRWASPDPAGQSDSPNLHSFLNNDGLANIDVFGYFLFNSELDSVINARVIQSGTPTKVASETGWIPGKSKSFVIGYEECGEPCFRYKICAEHTSILEYENSKYYTWDIYSITISPDATTLEAIGQLINVLPLKKPSLDLGNNTASAVADLLARAQARRDTERVKKETWYTAGRIVKSYWQRSGEAERCGAPVKISDKRCPYSFTEAPAPNEPTQFERISAVMILPVIDKTVITNLP